MGGGSKTTTTNQNQQAVTTPQTPNYALDPVKNYFAGVSNYQQSDPYQFVTPTNSLQNAAYGNASGLFGANGMYGQAAAGAQGVMNAAPTTAQAGQTQASLGLLGPAAQATATGYQAPNLGQAAQVQAPVLGNAATATAANAGQAQGVNLQGYQAGTLGNAAQAGPVGLNGQATQATATSLLDNLQAYQNPATQQLVDTTLASMDDNAGRVRAQQQAQFAKSGAFGGSRAGIAQAQTEADLARERGLGEANLRSQAWNAATGLSTQDAAMRQATSLANMGAQNQRSETLAGLTTQNNQFNTGQQNQYGLAQFDANNAASQFGANAANQGSLYNAAATNDRAALNSGYQQQANLANMGAANDFSLRGADLTQQANLANQNATNQFASQQAGLLADAGQFGANAQNQANLANMQAQNQFGLENFGAQNAMSQFNSGQANQLAQFNSGQQNDMQNQQLARQLQASGLLGDLAGSYGQNYRADLDMQSDLGNQLWAQQNAANNAPLTQLQNVGALLNGGMLGQVSGQTVTGQNSGVDNTKQSGGLFNSLLGVASIAAPFVSDIRLKEDVSRIGKTPGGLPIYSYRYKGHRQPQIGVMAQDVEIMQPGALGPPFCGFKTVDYARIM